MRTALQKFYTRHNNLEYLGIPPPAGLETRPLQKSAPKNEERIRYWEILALDDSLSRNTQKRGICLLHKKSSLRINIVVS